jgi:hypothetical protein
MQSIWFGFPRGTCAIVVPLLMILLRLINITIVVPLLMILLRLIKITDDSRVGQMLMMPNMISMTSTLPNSCFDSTQLLQVNVCSDINSIDNE